MPRVLGLDFGTKRVGAALSDASGRIATPLEVYHRQDDRIDGRHYRALVEREGVERLVVGLPVHTSGNESRSAELARSWGRWLAEATGLPLVFRDERYTSTEAEILLQGAGLKASQRKGKIDMIAATLLLQAYLDAGCPEQSEEIAPLDGEG
ncbi:MAG: Holliday junction resolvase RuvX [Isosphaeraceae bacterium]